MLPPVIAVRALFAGHRSSTSSHTDANISIRISIQGECMLILLDTRSNITSKYSTNFVLWDTITNEKTAKLIQLHTVAVTIIRHATLASSNTFGEYTSFCPYTLCGNALYENNTFCLTDHSTAVTPLFVKQSTENRTNPVPFPVFTFNSQFPVIVKIFLQ